MEARRSKSESCGEPVHLHEPVDGRAVATERKAIRPISVDRDEPAVEVRGSPPVQSQFRLTESAAPFARGEIEIVEPDGSFELVRTGTREKDDGGVRVDPIDRPHRHAWMVPQGSR